MEVYRFMSFFELYDLVVNNKLKFTKLKLMNDLNEGIYKALSFQLPSAFNIGFNKKHSDIINYHHVIKESTYISCWTKVPDSIAMWLLYSSDKMSIRVKTSKEKIEKYVNRFMEKNHWTNHIHSKEGTIQTFEPIAKIKEVEYVNIYSIVEKIKELHKKEREQIKELVSKYKGFEFLNCENYKNKFNEIRNNIIKEANDIIKDPLFYKDKSFDFEKEIRAIIEIGIRNEKKWEELSQNKENIDFIMGTSTFCFDENIYTDIYFPDILKVDVEKDFVEEICFDPRMPNFKKDVFLEILNIDRSLIVESKVFGYVGEEVDFTLKYFL